MRGEAGKLTHGTSSKTSPRPETVQLTWSSWCRSATARPTRQRGRRHRGRASGRWWPCPRRSTAWSRRTGGRSGSGSRRGARGGHSRTTAIVRDERPALRPRRARRVHAHPVPRPASAGRHPLRSGKAGHRPQPVRRRDHAAAARVCASGGRPQPWPRQETSGATRPGRQDTRPMRRCARMARGAKRTNRRAPLRPPCPPRRHAPVPVGGVRTPAPSRARPVAYLDEDDDEEDDGHEHAEDHREERAAVHLKAHRRRDGGRERAVDGRGDRGERHGRRGGGAGERSLRERKLGRAKPRGRLHIGRGRGGEQGGDGDAKHGERRAQT